MHGLTNTLFVGKVLKRLPSVGSTNQFALDWLASKMKPTDGTVVFTTNQTAGRGQIGSSWESEPDKNVAASLIFFPKFLEALHQWRLSEAVALGVADFLTEILGDGVRIKWPNDLYVFDKKIGGILIQNALAGTKIQSSVVGIGLNVNQTVWKTELPNPTSLFLETGREFDLENLLAALCQSVESRFLQLKSGADFRPDFLKKMYRFEQPNAIFETPDGLRFRGKIAGLEADGRLKIEVENGSERAFDFKQIRFVI